MILPITEPKTLDSLRWLPDWVGTLRSHLHDTVLHFWMHRMVDEKRGGFYGRCDARNQPFPEAEKGLTLNARILWAFSQAARLFPEKDYAPMARRAFEYLADHFHDTKHGGVFWTVDALGHPQNRKKQLYGQAFALYGYTEYFRLTQEPKALVLAQNLFRVMEAYGYDAKADGYWEAFGPDWSPISDVRLSEKDAHANKTMNTHLRILQAYTNLYRVWPNPQVAHRLRNLILLFLHRFVDGQGLLCGYFSDTWEPQSEGVSFGHTLEGSWLLTEAADVLAEKELKLRVREVALKMVEATLAQGMDSDGGLMNEGATQVLTDTDKHGWTQAEALVGLINAYQLSDKVEYLEQAYATWQFIERHMVDRQHGEWHWRVSRSGELLAPEDKAGPWKCPYHNGRALMECYVRIATITLTYIFRYT